VDNLHWLVIGFLCNSIISWYGVRLVACALHFMFSFSGRVSGLSDLVSWYPSTWWS